MRIRRYSIRVADEALVDLRRRLEMTRWPDSLDDESWSDGASLSFVQRLSRYWLHSFDWRAQEERLNGLPQYMAMIDGLDIHFVHQRGTGPSPMPLVLTHGWPGSFVEMERILPLLTDPGAHGGDPADSFHVVVPSLPGYGFSPAPSRPGAPLAFEPRERVRPPLGVALFPRELPMPPRSWVERIFNVTRWAQMPAGGHFAALEQPELLAQDIRAYFRPLRQG